MSEPTAEIQELPEQGAVLTFGRSWFADNQASRFWIKNDKIIACACGDDHTVVLTESRRVFSFGANEFGQLGLGNTKSTTRPSCVKALKPERCTAIGCGKAHTVVSTESGQLLSFGQNQDGQLGLGHTDQVLTPSPVVPWSGQVAQIAAGDAHTLVLTGDGRVFAFGSNSEGQCGLGGVESAHEPARVACDEKIVQIDCGSRHSALLTAGGRVLVCGHNESGQLGLGGEKQQQRPQPLQGVPRVTALACGGHHTLLLTDEGEVYCFGSGSEGQLGLGVDLPQSPTPRLLALEQAPVAAIAAGTNHSAIITADNRLLTFGDGQHGKLCIADIVESRFLPSLVGDLDYVRIVGASLGGCQSMLLVDRLDPEIMLGDLPPLTNGLHEPEEPITASQRQNLGNADDSHGSFNFSMDTPYSKVTLAKLELALTEKVTLPPVGRLPPLRGAPRISPSASQQEEVQARLESHLHQVRDAAELQSFTSAIEAQPPTAQVPTSTAIKNESLILEDDSGCSPLSRFFGRFRKSHTSVPTEARDNKKEEEEPHEEPDEESRPEGSHRGGGGPSEEGSPERLAVSPALAPAAGDADITEDEDRARSTAPTQSKTCAIL